MGEGLRKAAREAWVAARSDREGEARAHLGQLLAPFDVATLETVDVQVAETFTLFVFHDPADDIHLAARTTVDGWEAFVVTDTDGWTLGSERIRSLAYLHELLPPAPEPDPEPAYPDWYQRHAPDAWSEGDRVIHNGEVWEATAGGQGGNTWEPGVYGWVKVTG